MKQDTLIEIIVDEFGDGHLYSWLLERYIDVQNKLMQEPNLSKEAQTINNFIFQQLTKLKEETKELEQKICPKWILFS